MKRIRWLLVGILLLVTCSAAPYMGRRQVILVFEGEEAALREDAYRHILRDSVITHQPEAGRIVCKVGERIARVADRPNYGWEFTIINDPETVNAFALPGGKVATYTGLPSAESLDSPAAKSERELVKRIRAINHYVDEQNGERPVAEALAYELRLNPQAVAQERQRLRIGYGQYAALRGLSYLGRGSINKVFDDYQRVVHGPISCKTTVAD